MRKKAKTLRNEKLPNMSILEKTQTKIKKNAEEEIKKEKEAKELAEKMKPVNITT
eukprot:CAMPEP_0114595230 /NCGR_PEP_ID=MMETSP0125-20121206/17001_1 /TAXON_ID=485358 ORGANISM="Aristerostoma sp., Strain ATCC 50986" /NCGR_SAMPLE_ID=MMETSP0125 /ASSEMBLY_ACC=CAM_ASM_000245 /LENGTH=54 /DNA_ID=CAMNT_0001796555 /DNA_START=214 /DNA_END=378 /DNA_ORIENTATION=+